MAAVESPAHRVAKAKQMGDFVEGFTSRIVMAVPRRPAPVASKRISSVTATDKQHEIRNAGPLGRPPRPNVLQVMNS